MKIILATDFSSANEALSHYAIDFLRGKEGSLILFHVYEDEEDYEEAKGKMDSTVNMLSEFGGVNVLPVLVEGDPEKAILDLIEKEHADLVLMGTRGRGNKLFLEGSLSRKLTRVSPVPLLSIHEDYRYRPNSEVLFVTNFDENDASIIRRMFSLLNAYEPHLHVIHFIIDGDPAKAAKQLQELKDAVGQTDFSDHITYGMIFATEARDTMRTYCDNNDISLVAFVPRAWHVSDIFFKDRVVNSDFYNLHLPLLSFRNEE